MNSLAWVVLGGLAVLIAITVVFVRRGGENANGDLGLGSISTRWLSEHLSQDRDASLDR